jgi:hypothetical protein
MLLSISVTSIIMLLYDYVDQLDTEKGGNSVVLDPGQVERANKLRMRQNLVKGILESERTYLAMLENLAQVRLLRGGK